MYPVFLLVNEFVSYYFSYLVHVSALVKPYLVITFLNVGNVMIVIDPLLINIMRYSGWLNFSSTWLMIYSLNSIYWTLYLFSVGDIGTFKLSSAHVNLLLWSRINCSFPPLLLWFCPLILCRSYMFVTCLVPLSPWFGVKLSLSPGVGLWIVSFVLVFMLEVIMFLKWTHRCWYFIRKCVLL